MCGCGPCVHYVFTQDLNTRVNTRVHGGDGCGHHLGVELGELGAAGTARRAWLCESVGGEGGAAPAARHPEAGRGGS